MSYCSKYEAQNVELPVEGENDILEFSGFSSVYFEAFSPAKIG